MSKLTRTICLLMLSGFGLLRAQDQPSYGSVPREKLEHSRAEMEAEQRVSLSADTIVQLLQREPGLLLQVKKALVRKAFEQGRLLDPADLTDEALFRLLREDDNVRILATQEIEDRSYIRPKPSKQELAQDAYRQMQRTPLRTEEDESQPTASTAPGVQRTAQSQEEKYWSRHDNQNVPAGSGAMQNAVPPSYAPDAPGYAPDAPQPQPRNPARDLNRTQLESPPNSSDNPYEFGGNDYGQMPRVRPEELPELLQASASQASSSGMSMNGNVPQQIPGMGSASLNPAPVPDSRGNPLPDRYPQFPQRASLDRRYRATPPLNDPTLAQPVIRHQANPYANLPSLYDLYSQVSRRSPVLERFGADIFRNGTGNLDNLPMDLPVGPDYVLGPGDGLNIELWGSVSQRLQRVVDRQGQVALPEAGPVQVSGRSLGDVQRLMQSAMRSQYRDVEVDVSLGRLRTVRVYVVGDVQRPGAYDISSLSTPLNALYVAGGPSAGGSLRTLQHYRGKQLVQEIDTYDMLLHGVSQDMQRIQAGDIIKVPPIGPEVTVEGMVRRPAIYELNAKANLAEVLELAGGVLPSGALRHIDVERLVAHESRTMLRIDLPETNDVQAVNKALQDFQIESEDKIRISPIVSYSDKTIYLDGHVFHPGKYPYKDGMTVSDLVQSNELLPEPSRRHAEIIRLQPPDFTPVVLAFNLGEVLDGSNKNLTLKPFDTVRIFGRYDFEDPPVVSVSGEVRDPGDHVTNGVTRLRDAVYLAGGVTPDAELDDAQVFRHTSDGKMRVISIDLAKALAGDQANDVLLEPKDRVFIHRNLAKTDPPAVTVQGEVARPGKYPLGQGMTASQLVQLAGGLKRSADSQTADLTRYLEQDGQKRIGEQRRVDVAKAMNGVAESDLALRDGDVLTVPQIAGWNDIGASVTLKGEVMRPGTYGIHEGEKLSSVLARAGGFRADAYPYAAVLERTQVRELEEKNRADLIRRVKSEGDSLSFIPEADPNQKMAKEAALAQWQTAIAKLQSTPPIGRLVVHISSDVKRWANTPADLQVRAGDVLLVPKQPNFVMVDGAVYNPTAITFRPGRNAEWYLRQAGGPTQMANRKAVFVVRADGSVVGGSGGMFGGGALSTELRPGDLVMVPEKAVGGTSKWKTTLEASQLVYSIGVAIQVAKSF
jgi:protein involved in polysaccharide export with SLBB domain